MIYTFGYSGRTLDELINLAKELNAVVVDIRFRPLSAMPDWSGRMLQKTLGPSYCHIKKLGNKNFKTNGPIEIEDMDGGLAALGQVLDRGKAAILLCGCKDVRHCHRQVVANEILTRWLDVMEVQHL